MTLHPIHGVFSLLPVFYQLPLPFVLVVALEAGCSQWSLWLEWERWKKIETEELLLALEMELCHMPSNVTCVMVQNGADSLAHTASPVNCPGMTLHPIHGVFSSLPVFYQLPLPFVLVVALEAGCSQWSLWLEWERWKKIETEELLLALEMELCHIYMYICIYIYFFIFIIICYCIYIYTQDISIHTE